MDICKIIVVCVVCVALTRIQGILGFCNSTETPSINLCQINTTSAGPGRYIYLDSVNGAPIVTKVECNCTLSFTGSGTLNFAYRSDDNLQHGCGINFTMDDATWGCNTTRFSSFHQGRNNLTYLKAVTQPIKWASCLGIMAPTHSITVQCYPYRKYYAPDEVVNGTFGEWSSSSACSVTCGTGTQTWVRRCDDPAPRNNGTECLAENGTRTLIETEIRPCTLSSCPVNGDWGLWSAPSPCSVTCGSGTRTRTRNCDSPSPQNGGEECLATDGTRVLEETGTVPCLLNACPVNGEWGLWSTYSPCSVTCGSGTRTRTRSCDSPSPQNGGEACLVTDGTRVLEETGTELCLLNACPADDVYTEWSSWTVCTRTCGGGSRQRSRDCTNPNSLSCDGSTSETEDCNTNACPVDGGWSLWSAWSTCSSTCGGGGTKIRNRLCNNPYPEIGGKQCVGNSSETTSCGVENCPVNGYWSVWSGWDTCSKSCGGGGYQRRNRNCSSPPPQYGGQECVGNSIDVQACGNANCPIHGGWGYWQAWSQCSKMCGSGIQTRYRYCDSPLPQYGGNHCIGNYNETQNCYGNNCPVDGLWGDWSSWTTCSVSCESGTYSRHRECDSPAPQNSGFFCYGSRFENETCTNVPCPINGNWGPWSPFSSCSRSCGSGTVTRTRLCNSPEPTNGGQNCPGSSSENLTCKQRECQVNGNWGLWSPWSICATTCGSGNMSRLRECNNPEPSLGGDNCPGESTEHKRCDRDPCPIDGGVGHWSPWSMCSASCGKGERSRLRFCDSPSPQFNGHYCSEILSQTDVCSIANCTGTATSQSTSQSTSSSSSTPTAEPPTAGAFREKEEESANILAIVLGVIGGLLFFLLLLLLICCLCRRKRGKGDEKSIRYFAHGDDVTVTENELYNYDGETPSHATNALFVGGIPETPNSPGYIPHFTAGDTGDRYAVIMDSNGTKPKSKERPKLDTFNSQEDKGKPEANGDVRASTDSVKLAENYNEDTLGNGVENPGYDDSYIAPYDSTEGGTKPKTSTSATSQYDYIDNAKLQRDNEDYENEKLAGDYATRPDDTEQTVADETEESDRYKRFISSEPEESPDDGYLKSPKRDTNFEFPDIN